MAEILPEMNRVVIIFSIFFVALGACKDEDAYLGDRYFNSKEYQKAIDAYTKYLELKPFNIKSIYNRGRAFEELGRYTEAVNDFNKVLKLEPNHVQSRLSVVNDLYRKKLYKDAIYQCDLVLKHSQNKMAYFMRARGNQKIGKTGSAMDDYNATIALDQEFGEAYFYRGTLKIYKRLKQSACNDFKIAESLDIVAASKARKDYCL